MSEQINYRDLAYETANRGGDVGAMIDVAVQAQQALDAARQQLALAATELGQEVLLVKSLMRSCDQLSAALRERRIERDAATQHAEAAEGRVRVLEAEVAALTDILWRENPGYHRCDPCIFCGRAFDDYGIGECPGTNVRSVMEP